MKRRRLKSFVVVAPWYRKDLVLC